MCSVCIVISGIFGGQLLGVRSVSGLAFYDWETLELVRRIEITPKHVFWSEGGTLVSRGTVGVCVCDGGGVGKLRNLITLYSGSWLASIGVVRPFKSAIRSAIHNI